MNNENTITFYMLEDHKLLDEKLDKLLDGYGLQLSDIKRLFEEFRLQLEKHLTTEEKAIFSFTEYDNSEIQNAIRDLLTDHAQMRNLLKEMSEEIATNYPKGFQGFVELLRHHQKTENDFLYPKLDRELDERQKSYIVDNIRKFR